MFSDESIDLLRSDGRLSFTELMAGVALAISLLLSPMSVVIGGFEVYTGPILGVNARVTLHRCNKYALVTLTGTPLCGKIEGTAWFDDDGDVKLEEEFEKALRRRFCSIQSVYANEFEHTLTVRLKLPLLGSKELTMKQLS